MKLVINIPCLNEEKTLPKVLRELPKKIPGVDEIRVHVIDDGSTDKTVEIARKHGAYVYSHKTNRGLGLAFRTGQEAALDVGADIMVNTDADNQYPSRYIPALVKPVVEGKADMVIGNRQPWKIKHFGLIKRFFQYVGNKIVGFIGANNVPDQVSGFRAYSKEALLRLNVTVKFSYVIDTIVQAAQKGLAVQSIKIKTNPPTRKSRLFSNIFQHMRKSGYNVLRVFIIYQPFKTFLIPATLLFLPGIFFSLRFLWFYLSGDGSGHVQSLILAAILIILSMVMIAMGVLRGINGVNRGLLEEQLYFEKKRMYEKHT